MPPKTDEKHTIGDYSSQMFGVDGGQQTSFHKIPGPQTFTNSSLVNQTPPLPNTDSTHLQDLNSQPLNDIISTEPPEGYTVHVISPSLLEKVN